MMTDERLAEIEKRLDMKYTINTNEVYPLLIAVKNIKYENYELRTERDFLKKEVERLSEFERMYKDLCK